MVYTSEGPKAVADAICFTAYRTSISKRRPCAAQRPKSRLTSINLLNNFLGPEGAKALAPALGDSASVTQIDLSHNRLRDEGANALAPAITANASLTYLWYKLRTQTQSPNIINE